MARLSREESRVQTCERLLVSARKVFAERGVAAATVDEISAGADFSKGAFYANFRSKDELFIALLQRHLSEEAQALKQVVEQARSFDGLLQVLHEFYTALEQQPEVCILALEFQMSAWRDADLLAPLTEQFNIHRLALSELLEGFVKRHGLRLTEPAPLLLTRLMGMTNGLLLQRLISPHYRDGMAPDMIVSTLRQVVERAPS